MHTKNCEKSQKLNFRAIFHIIIVIINFTIESHAAGACDRSRKIFEGVTYGEITDGINANYTQDSHCEWLIKANNSSQFITLKFMTLKTECSYDYIFIYDGNSYESSRLLGSFSGQTDPQEITAKSGFMLILLYSDTNYNLDGFRATFSITNCLNNCSSNGLCVNHSCHCTTNYSGLDCSLLTCDCGEFGVCENSRCKCGENYSGQKCALSKLNASLSQWYWISSKFYSFSPRAAHTSVYDEKTDAVYTFGGYDLNNVMGKLEIFRFNENKWIGEDSSEVEVGVKVSQSDEFWFRDALLAHVNAKRSNEWKKNYTNEEFSSEKNEIEDDDDETTVKKSQNYVKNYLKPMPRYGHSSCKINDTFFIYGGKLADGSLSNELWMYNMSSNQWSLRALKSALTPPRLTRHSLTYVDYNEFIYLFGGSLSDGEFSSDLYRLKIDFYDAENEHWEIVHPRGGKSFDYRIVAHTAIFYPPTKSLIIYGGIIAGIARFSKLSDRMFSFNLIDNHWSEIFYRKNFIPRERAFHTAVLSDDYMIVFGGYSHRHNKEEICYDNQMYLYNLKCHLWVNQEILGGSKYAKKQDDNIHHSYPKKQGVFAHTAMIRQKNQLLIHGGYHGNVNNDFLAFIIPNMTECSIYKTSSECISNPSCGYCSSDGLCYHRTLSTCLSNLQTTRCHGICPTLRDCRSCLIHGDGSCKWCIQTGKCNHKNDRDACGESDDEKSQEIDDKNLCASRDKPPGLIYMKYLQPYDFSSPDYVGIINTTMVEFSASTAPSIDSSNSGEVIARLHGYVKTNAKNENIKVCGSYADISLKFDDKMALNFTADQNLCISTKLTKEKSLVDLQARRHKPQIHIHSKIGIQNNSSKPFTFEYLEPFETGDCENYKNCRHCLSDAACSWCDLKNTCVSRNVNEIEVCSDGLQWRYLIINSDQCVNCSNFISCQSCSSEESCEWWNEDAKCERRGRSMNGVKNISECASPCYERKNCENCLNNKGKCVWCQETSTCFSFSIYTSEFQFGLCREWIDQLIVSTSGVSESYGHQCKSCEMFKNCSTCLRSLNCGWCFKENNPIEGACVDGDFSGSSFQCNAVLNTTDSTLYQYESCPDVDECLLTIHDCHQDANCINTDGSFLCQCKKGFIGDGKKKCDKTCNETCIHGRCSNFPDYKCICNLGWTGSDCSINCNCNNHSECSKGIGICDECQDYTEGEFCEKCKIGSYGNATTIGCLRCNCNGHADENAGLCDQKSGKCFCLDNTEGENCEFCSQNYYGDAKSNGRCYLQCQSRGVLLPTKSQGIGSYRAQNGIAECLWLLQLNASIANGSRIQFEVEESNVTCFNNAIYVYNSISDFSDSNLAHKRLLNAICDNSNIISESKSGEIAIYFRKTSNFEGFNGIVRIFSCYLNTCDSPYTCINNTCKCPFGFKGSKCEIEICKSNCTNGFCDSVSHECICNENFTGDDCSMEVKANSITIKELFNTQIIDSSFQHLRKTLPRFGNSLNADRRGFLWFFGGFSITNGALNDIRQFDTKNSTWIQVTVDGTASKMPLGRFFHASEIKMNSIYIYGGLSGDFKLLSDFWAFNIHEQRWIEVESDENPGALAGHTMHVLNDDENEVMILIGGYNSTSLLWLYDFEQKNWSKLSVMGSPPSSLFGHSSAIHSQVVYIFGGYQNDLIDNKLYTLRRVNSTWIWTLLPIFSELNRPEENLPRARSLHSSIPFQNHLIIHGGLTNPLNNTDFLNAYVYKCNSYIRLPEIIGNYPQFQHSQAVAIDNESFFIINLISSQFSIHRVSIPSDICQLFSSSKYTCRLNRGCSFATTTTISNSTSRSTYCFSSDQKETKKNELTASAFNWGATCDEFLLSTRNCTSFTNCDECTAVFPIETSPACKWSTNKKCYIEKRPKNEIEMQFCDAKSEKIVSNCSNFENCTSCAINNCVWSVKVNKCIDEVFTSLLCGGGICGANIRNQFECPVSCDSTTMCSQCLANSNCGWCNENGNGIGKCMNGNVIKSSENCSSDSWNYLKCPAEDECTNGHHNCDKVSEKCVDLVEGFQCICAEGYRSVSEADDEIDWKEMINGLSRNDKEMKIPLRVDACLPICKQGCVYGTCTSPDVCKCNFGYVGSNCSIACKCSGHSDCAGPDQLDVCLQCMNNTRGDRCEKCEKFYVKKSDGKCESCSSFCYGHTDTCAGANVENAIEGPSEIEAVCLSCGNFTKGRRCDSCVKGYFRGTSNLFDPCRKCMCNGHGDECDPVTGEQCNCGNNTESDHTCPAASSKSDKNQIQVYHCYMSQCAKCRESYSGHPKNGHQCYKHITIESRMCLNEAKPFDECEHHLPSGKTQFFVIQPRFMNVDIRIIIDVSEGEIDLQMTSNDDSFVVFTNQSNGNHEILLDSKYQWVQDDDDGVRENLNITPLVTSSKKNFENIGASQSTSSTSSQNFRVVDRVAGDVLITHVTLRQSNMLLRVFGMKNRLIVTLPQHIHNLSGTRFFIAIRAANHAKMTTGIVYFRQDQLHIDLFVFFSVFFSCFFLFLAVCVVIWKAKQADDMRRARQRHVVEMFNMAQRPYSAVMLDVTPETPNDTQNSPKTRHKTKMSINYVPVAIETTSDNIAAICTVFIRLPETKQRRRPVCLGSTLISSTKQSIFLNKPLARIANHNV